MDEFWTWLSWAMIAIDAVLFVAFLTVGIRDLRETRREVDERHSRLAETLRQLQLVYTLHATVRVRRYDEEGRLVSDSRAGDDEA